MMDVYNLKTFLVNLSLHSAERLDRKGACFLSPKTQFMIKIIRKFRFWIFLQLSMRRITLEDRQRHIYICWKTGCGKSELIKAMVYSELTNKIPKSSIIVIDPHGDMANEIAKFKEFRPNRKMNRLVYIDPHLKPWSSPSINPFDINDKSDNNVNATAQEIKRILDVLLKGAGITNQMDSVIIPCITTLLRSWNGSFSELQRFMDDSANQDLVDMGRRSTNLQHRQFFYRKFYDKCLRATKHGIYTRMQVLLNDQTFQNLISNKSTLNLETLIEQKKIIIFKLTLGEIGSDSVEAFGRFVIWMLRVIALRRSRQPWHERTPTYAYIDEFQNFISDDLEKCLTQLRKYRLYLVLSSQYVWQHVNKYLQKALFWVWVIIAGSNEQKSRKRIQEETGILSTCINLLKKWEFFIKAWNKLPFKLRVPTFLLQHSHSMSGNDWEQVKRFSLKNYYEKIWTIFDDNEWFQDQDNSRLFHLEKLFPKYQL